MIALAEFRKGGPLRMTNPSGFAGEILADDAPWYTQARQDMMQHTGAGGALALFATMKAEGARWLRRLRHPAAGS